MTGIVRGFELATNRDSSQTQLMLQVEISGSDDIQLVEYMTAAGDNSIPPEGTIVNILQAGPAWKIAIASNDTNDFDSSLTEGDRKIYSKDTASFIKVLSDGTIEINGNADFAVAFTDLNTALQVFITALNTHTHPDPVSGTSGPPTAPMSLDISAAQVTGVKLP